MGRKADKDVENREYSYAHAVARMGPLPKHRTGACHYLEKCFRMSEFGVFGVPRLAKTVKFLVVIPRPIA